MKIYKHVDGRYFILFKGDVYRFDSKRGIHKHPCSSYFELSLADHSVSLVKSPPIAVSNIFEELKVKLILGLPYEDI